MLKIWFLVNYILSRLYHFEANLYNASAAALKASRLPCQDNGPNISSILFLLINDTLCNYNTYQITPSFITQKTSAWDITRLNLIITNIEDFSTTQSWKMSTFNFIHMKEWYTQYTRGIYYAPHDE